MANVLLTAPAKCLEPGSGSLNVLSSLQDICNADLYPYEKAKDFYTGYKLVISIGTPLQRVAGTETAHIWCSPIGQLELAGEDSILLNLLNKALRKHSKLGYLLCTSKTLTHILRKLYGKNILYLPPFLTDRQYLMVPIAERSGIVCIGMNRNNKNYLNQYVAASLLTNDELHIIDNGCGRGMRSREMAMRLFNIKHEFHPFIPETEYYNFLKTKRLGMQVSYSESFCYFVYELARMGIPSIVSGAVWWYLEDEWLTDHCVVKNIDDAEEIAFKANFLLTHNDRYMEATKRVKELSEKIGKRHKQEARELIKKILVGKG